MDVNTNFPAPDVPDLPNMPDSSIAFDSSVGSIESVPISASGRNEPTIPAFDSLPDFVPPAVGAAGLVPGPLPFSAPAGDKPAGTAFDSSPVEAMKRESDGFDPGVIAALAAEPTTRRELGRLHTQTSNVLFTAIDEVYGMLAPDTKPRSSTLLPTGPTNIRALMVAQRQGEIMSKERRALAEGIVMGSLINVDNPQWTPGDAATCKPVSQSALAALMRMNL
jgi:hypothetical protein